MIIPELKEKYKVYTLITAEIKTVNFKDKHNTAVMGYTVDRPYKKYFISVTIKFRDSMHIINTLLDSAAKSIGINGKKP
jgi:hypothetical protein